MGGRWREGRESASTSGGPSALGALQKQQHPEPEKHNTGPSVAADVMTGGDDKSLNRRTPHKDKVFEKRRAQPVIGVKLSNQSSGNYVAGVQTAEETALGQKKTKYRLSGPGTGGSTPGCATTGSCVDKA